MAEGLAATLASLSLERLAGPEEVIIQALAAGGGVRLGQCAVLSTKVHAFNSHSPEHVQIMVNADAGQVFYHRRDSGMICHLDIFHQCGTVDHALAARYVCQAVDVYHKLAGAQAVASQGGLVNPDLIDIQTAAGGGRITGTLTGGQKESLRRVHENHVHLALHLPSDHIRCLFFIVAAIETAILTCGCELRCNEQITCIHSTDTQADLSPYTGQTDSQLTGQREEAQPCSLDNAVTGKQPGPADQAVKPSGAGNKQEQGLCKSQTLVTTREKGPAFTEFRDREPVARVTPSSSFFAAGLSDSVKQALACARNRPEIAAGSSSTQHKRPLAGGLIAGSDRPAAIALDVAATVTAAARQFAEQSEGRLRIRPADLRFTARRPCLSRIYEETAKSLIEALTAANEVKQSQYSSYA
ncbi:hypothetical protein [Sporomusa termitida]|uniref:Uncharacterized protein n=1 Tax=Sporomusa termitida TaxID=2377 RepID=A0A517E0Y9_9FIRM|nr:hypothetical protein [Sporomusa termitida]QDR83166.1 hypothetical protein SPTER_46440 [Sporomusa termitida]